MEVVHLRRLERGSKFVEGVEGTRWEFLVESEKGKRLIPIELR